MTDRPIIFSAPMIKALLEGRKTQTRRVIKGVRQDNNMVLTKATKTKMGITTHVMDAPMHPHLWPIRARMGDRLWVRENWQGLTHGDYQPTKSPICEVRFAATDTLSDAGKDVRGYPWRPSIHMPRWASRLTLIVTDVRVQRLQDISEADAWAEGCKQGDPWDSGNGFFPAEEPSPDGHGWVGWDDAREWYADLWDTLNGPDAWDANPWVAAITFTVQRGNIDRLAQVQP